MGNIMSDMGSLEYDTGWKNTWQTDFLEYSDDFEPYYTAANEKPRIRRIGNRVFLSGYIKTIMPIVEIGTINSFTICSIADTQFYPKVPVRSVNQCSHFGKALITVDTLGDITISRVYCRTWADNEVTEIASGSFITLDMSWFVD